MGKYLAIVICAVFLFNPYFSRTASAANEIQTKVSTKKTAPDMPPISQDKTINTKDAAIWQKVQKEEASNKKRYVLIAKDKRFYYYLDRKTARWIYEPYTKKEIMDVWIQLVDANKKDQPDENYSNVPDQVSYLLDHYYIRPKSRQIQFLCELEVTGQPSNTVRQNVYSIKNWEDVIPGSVEETIYNAVMATKGQLVKVSADNRSIDRQASDFIDRVFNIGL